MKTKITKHFFSNNQIIKRYETVLYFKAQNLLPNRIKNQGKFKKKNWKKVLSLSELNLKTTPSPMPRLD